VLNGGAHADKQRGLSGVHDHAVGAESFSEALRWSAETFHTLRRCSEEGYNTSVGDEGGFAPSLSPTARPSSDSRSYRGSRHTPGEQISIALDPASSEFYNKETGKYVFKKSDSASFRARRW